MDINVVDGAFANFYDIIKPWINGNGPTGNPGDYSFCSTLFPCGEGHGDCDKSSECAWGLTCVHNVGADYGWDSAVDVCEDHGDPGDDGFCSTDEPCAEGHGDCDDMDECEYG